MGSRQSQGVTWNLSLGGMQVDVGHLKPGEAVRVSFRLPASGALVDAVGGVVWVNDRRKGIKFEHLSAKNVKAIRDFIGKVESPGVTRKISSV